jgi:hypothetical protein
MKIDKAFARPEARTAILAETRKLKMARSPHAYVRGNTAKFYEWLQDLKIGTLPNGPRFGFLEIVTSTVLGPSRTPWLILRFRFAILIKRSLAIRLTT